MSSQNPSNPSRRSALRCMADGGLVKSMPTKPALAIHTGDITRLSKAQEFDLASQLLFELPVPELHTVPGEHDVTDDSSAEYFCRFGKASDNRGYYSFDHEGVHFVDRQRHASLQGKGNITFHTARSTAFPQPTAGNGPGPVPLTVARDQSPRMLGVTTVSFAGHPGAAPLHDSATA